MAQRTERRVLSVIVPALDEAPCIERVLEGLVALPEVDEIVVVDGGSRDGTCDIVLRFEARDARVRLLRQSQPGFGPGLWEAFAAARGDLLAIVDADGSHDWQDLPRMRALIEEGGHDYVLGSRYRAPFRWRGPLRWPFSSSDDDSLVHEWGNLGIVLLAKWLLGYPLSDVMMGLQMWRRAVLDEIMLREPSQAFEAELKMKVHRAGFRMVEISTHERPRIGGEAKLDAWRDGLATARVLLREWRERRAERVR